jgi:hypothetical protein
MSLDRESDGAHLLFAIFGDLLWAPWRHPNPIDSESLDNAIKRLGSLLFDNVS